MLNAAAKTSSLGRLLSVNVGLPRDITWRGESIHTAVWKHEVQGKRMVRRLNVHGDGQGDLAGHGGEHRAVMVYQTASYRYWETYLGRNGFIFGQFGENFTVEGLADDQVCIGDRYRIGRALFEVTQPRVTCYRVGIRMDEPNMAALLVSHHRPGFYFRVLEEGEVEAGDEITKVADGPERLTVADVDSLLYLPGHPRPQLEGALRIPALSHGWKESFRALLDQGSSDSGNAGLTSSAGSPPAWSGFRSLRVRSVDRESASVASFSFEPTEGSALPAALPGQFLVLRLRIHPEAPPVLRNYSISGPSAANVYRVSVKREVNGVASSFLHTQLKPGNAVDVSAPRGTFTLRPGAGSVVLLSAGIGVTPVLAMLHALSSIASPREIWWLHGARNRAEHPFAKESRDLLQGLEDAKSHTVYSKPGPDDQLGVDYDSDGHLDMPLLKRLGVARDAAFYVCGPAAFIRSFTTGLTDWGVASSNIYTEAFGPEASLTPGIAKPSRPAPHPPNLSSGTPGFGPQVSFTRSGLTVAWDSRFLNLLELAEACDVPVRWSCRTGVCHTCECALIGGAVQYAPSPLQAPAEGNLLICCSQPNGAVEIDL